MNHSSTALHIMERHPLRAGLREVTVGVTIAIPEPWSGVLQQARKDSGDLLADIVPPHLTLLAPTALAADLLEVLAEHLALVAGSTSGFAITLHGVTSFLPLSPVAFVPVIDGGNDLATLAAGIRSGPIPLRQQYPFHPHVTIAQGVESEAMERVFRSLMEFDATVQVNRFTLSISDSPPTSPAALWRPWREFRLATRVASRSTPPLDLNSIETRTHGTS